MVATDTVHASQAVVRTGAGLFGHAWMFSRAERCYALTPNHVVLKSSEVDLVVAAARAPKYLRGTVVARWPEMDLALLGVTAGDLRDCGAALVLRIEIEQAMRTSASGELRLGDTEGGVAVHRAELVQLESEGLGIRSRDVTLQPTFSGGVVYIEGVPIGMMRDVTPKGVGVLIRMDEATARALDYLNAAPAAATAAALTDCAASGKNGASPDDVAAAANGGRVAAWQGLPASIETGPENLIANCRYWKVPNADFPLSVTVQVGGGPVRIRAVVLDAAGVSPPERPTRYEVLVRSGTTGSWRAVGSGQLGSQDSAATQQLPDVLAMQVMVKFYGSQGGTALAVRRIHVLRSRSD